MLWLSDTRGINIPRDFACSFINRDKDINGVDAEQWSILEAGPEHDQYWDVWHEVCERAIITDLDHNQYRIHQEGDCWLIPVDWVWSDIDMFYVYKRMEDETDE